MKNKNMSIVLDLCPICEGDGMCGEFVCTFCDGDGYMTSRQKQIKMAVDAAAKTLAHDNGNTGNGSGRQPEHGSGEQDG